MTKAIPAIQKYMTTVPHSIGIEQPLGVAAAMMAEYHIRHLPVLHGGQLKGILTDRDLRLIQSFPDVDLEKATVEEAMTEEPFTVSPEAPLDEVVSEMAEKRYGCAVVVQNHKVVGIFTTVDVCQALAELLHSRLRS
jgi:acetoin utilization protein AcuB